MPAPSDVFFTFGLLTQKIGDSDPKLNGETIPATFEEPTLVTFKVIEFRELS
jgi:hypothetical protein